MGRMIEYFGRTSLGYREVANEKLGKESEGLSGEQKIDDRKGVGRYEL